MAIKHNERQNSEIIETKSGSDWSSGFFGGSSVYENRYNWYIRGNTRPGLWKFQMSPYIIRTSGIGVSYRGILFRMGHVDATLHPNTENVNNQTSASTISDFSQTSYGVLGYDTYNQLGVSNYGNTGGYGYLKTHSLVLWALVPEGRNLCIRMDTLAYGSGNRIIVNESNNPWLLSYEKIGRQA